MLCFFLRALTFYQHLETPHASVQKIMEGNKETTPCACTQSKRKARNVKSTGGNMNTQYQKA